MKTFAIIGAAGYVAQKHIKAIKDLNGVLTAVYDPIMSFCNNFDIFKQECIRHKVDYLVVCSPTNLHKEHCIFGLEAGMDVICEKPVVLYESELNDLIKLEQQTSHKIYCMHQLRYIPKNIIDAIKNATNVNLTFHALRINNWGAEN